MINTAKMVGARIRQCRDRLAQRRGSKVSQADLARLCGWENAQNRISNYERGERNASREDLMRIAAATGCRVEWIQFGTGSPEPDGIAESGENYGGELEPGPEVVLSDVPIVGTTEGGPNKEWLEFGYPPGHGDGYLDAPTKDPNAYALRVSGGSMEPRMRAGEVVLVQPNTTPVPGDEVVVARRDGQVMVKELVYWRNGELALDSVAAGFPRIILNEADVEFVHVIAGIFRASAVKKRRPPS